MLAMKLYHGLKHSALGERGTACKLRLEIENKDGEINPMIWRVYYGEDILTVLREIKKCIKKDGGRLVSATLAHRLERDEPDEGDGKNGTKISALGEMAAWGDD